MINLLRGPNRLRTLVGGSNRPRPSFMATLVLGTVSTNGQAGTYTNATVKTYPDWENVLRYAISGQSCHPGCRVVVNLIPAGTEDLTLLNAAATKANSSVTATTITLNTVNASYWYAKTTVSQSWSGRTVVCRVAVTSAVSRTVLIRISGSTDATGQATANVALVAGIPKIISVTASGFNTTVQTMAFGFDNTAANGASDTSAGTITFTQLQLEDVTGQSNQNPGEYVSVGVLSAPYHGMNVDGVKGFATQNGNTVASNVVTEATGAAISASTLLGYRSEEARTNLILQSADLNTTWTKVNATISATKVVGPNGTTTAQKIEETTTGAAVHRVEQQLLKAASAITYTASASLKQAERSWALVFLTNAANTAYTGYWFNLATGAVGSVIQAGAYTTGTPRITQQANGFWRCSITGTTDAAGETNLYIYATTGDGVVSYAGVAGSGIYCENVQLEAGSFATSSIPTTTVAVTRNLDLDVYATSGNVNTNNVTISGTWTPNAAVASMGTTYIWGSYVDANNYTRIFHDGTNIIARKRIAGVNTDATKALAYAAGTSYIISARFSASSGIDIFVNGVIGTNNSNTAALQLGATFQLLADGNGVVAGSSELKNDRVYPVALSDAQVAQIPA